MPSARFLNAISECPPGEWDRLFGAANPFVRHAFLACLEDSGSVAAATGWQPAHLVLEEGGRLLAAMPLYLKAHSYGEFVFDWGWAEAYRRQGLEYYPKLLCAIPFSPVSGPRLGVAAGEEPGPLLRAAWAALETRAREVGASGWHLLFPDPQQRAALAAAGLEDRFLRREDVQFHWRNADYGGFDDFLATLRSSRRKNVRRERRRVAEQGVRLQRATGAAITDEDWAGFYRCYRATYEKRSGHAGYLTRGFFDALRDRMGDELMLVTARRDEALAGSALFLFDEHRLYGRYWGALEAVDCLHFEACFYQGIEFCIERRLCWFDPGTQGEHKLLRGFEPVRTVSYHWLADPRFHEALRRLLDLEQHHVDAYETSAREYLPFRRAGGDSD